MIFADSNITRGDGERRILRRVKLLGEPKLPLSNAFFVFIIMSAYCFYCPTRSSRPGARGRTPTLGANSKRITLDADAAMTLRSNQSDAASRQFYCSCPGCGASPKSNSSPKESVSCASAVLFLLCWSRYVLFLLWGSAFVIVVVQ